MGVSEEGLKAIRRREIARAFSDRQQYIGWKDKWRSNGRNVKDFRQLKVWQKAHLLTLAVYRLTASFPRDETYGLKSQMRRSASSIASNLAEGCGREGDTELARFCIIARGSASELEYHLSLARDIELITDEDHEKLAQRTTEIKRMLTALVQRLKA